MTLEEGSYWEAKYDEDNLNIVTRGLFSESSGSGSSKFEGDSRGTCTIFIPENEVKGGGDVRGRSADRG